MDGKSYEYEGFRGGLNNYIFENQESFETLEWTQADALVFAELSYFPFEKLMERYPEWNWANIMIEDCMELVRKYWGSVQILWSDNKKSLYEMAGLLMKSKRFAKLKITDIQVAQSSLENTQFAGITVHIPAKEGEFVTVAFRGTNGSREGWMEDFMLAYSDETQAQRLSMEYLKQISQNYKTKAYVVGHSKGGNNAMYAFLAAPLEVQESVEYIYNFDGPGFRAEVLEEFSSSYSAMLSKLDCYVPQTSMIGLLLNDHANQIHVLSENSLILQHDAFSWKIEDGSFVRNKLGTDEVGQFVNGVFDDIVSGMTDNQREVLVQLFDTYGLFSFIAKDPRFIGRKNRVASGMTALYERRGELEGKSLSEVNEWCADVCVEAWNDYAKLQAGERETVKTALTVFSFSMTHRFLSAMDKMYQQTACKAEKCLQLIQTNICDYESWLKEHKLSAIILASAADVGQHIISLSKEWVHRFFIRADEWINGYTSDAYQENFLSVDTQTIEECANRLRRVQARIQLVDELVDRYCNQLEVYDISKILNVNLTGAQGIEWIKAQLGGKREDGRVENCICYLDIARSMLEDAEAKLCVKILEL